MAYVTVTQKEVDGKKAAGLLIKNELTINNISEVKQEIAPLISNYEHFSLSLREIENIDLSAVQLLYSLRQTLEKKGKGIELDLQLPDELRSIVENAGFKDLL